MAQPLFSNEDVLSWFCATKPLPEVSENIPKVNGPGVARDAMLKKLKAEAAEAELAKQKSRRSTRPKGAPQHNAPVHESYYDRVRRLGEASRQYTVEEVDIIDDGDVGAGLPFNPNAQPWDDDYRPNPDLNIDVYKTFNFNVNLTPPLPIAAQRDNILRTIDSNPVTVIQGETGSGKSTQVAQYILDHHVRQGKYCNIVCTQPRRIAAKNLASYVAQCRQWKVGEMVGYQIGMDKHVGEKTRLTFVTVGVLLQKMVNMKNMNQFTHVILDEVHERDKDTDFCLLVVRKLLKTNSSHVKVILMSATIEAQMFANYFSSQVGGVPRPAPLCIVEGRTHPVLEYFLDDIRHHGTCRDMEVENPRVTEDTMNIAINLMIEFDKVDGNDPMFGKGDFMRGTVLVFLPGMPEIKEMEAKISNSKRGEINSWHIIPLHSTISSEVHREVFSKPPAGKRKIILATNIAESSITIPDIRYVIDFCLVKQLMCDWQTKYVCLKTVLASQASLTQRKGRAGRVAQGRCYRMVSRRFKEKYVQDYSTPEMLRCPLETVVLKAKKLAIGEPRSILGSALQPPKLDDIERAILNLKEVGALTVLYRGVNNPYNGDLTFVGAVLETLPIDVRLGRLVILGHVFGCLEDTIIIAAALSTRPVFTGGFTNALRAYKSRRSWAEGSDSDCIAFLNAYRAWKELHHYDNKETWCRRNYLNHRAMEEVDNVVKELKSRLSGRGIYILKPQFTRQFEADPQHRFILKLVIAGAFYPQYFSWIPVDEEASERAMSGHDAKTTVVLSGLPRNAERYSRNICELFKFCGRGKALHFEAFKAFVEFKRPHPYHRPHNDGGVLEAVYNALKLRHQRNKLSLFVREDGEEPVMEEEFPAERQVVYQGLVKKLEEKRLPESGTKQIIITEFIDAGHFWAQMADVITVKNIQELQDCINTRNLRPIICPPAMLVDVYCLAPFAEDNMYYRAKVVAVEADEERNETYAKVVFVDYGNVDWVNTGVLCEMTREDTELEMQAVECYLTSVKPSITSSPDGRWSHMANQRFKQLTLNKYLMISVYSRVNKALRVELYDTTEKEDVLVNEVLTDEGFAVKCDEPYQSMEAHIRTKASQASEATSRGKVRKESYQSTVRTISWTDGSKQLQSRSKCKKVELRGPDSMYEVSFHQMTIAGGYRQARVERESVNCIVINCDSLGQQHDRLMVAGYVALNPSGNMCIARNTTLLPNIPGLLHLVTLVFAPYAEMRTDELKRQYTGAICGLGFDPDTNESIYSEHDIELTFDTLITQEDLEMVNHLRLAINLAIGSEDAVGELNQHMLQKVQHKARELIKSLIMKSRDFITPYQVVSQGWNCVASSDMLRVDIAADYDEATPPLFPLHNGINISQERIDKQRSTRVLLLREKIKELRKKASDSKVPVRLACDLCNALCGSPFELKQHLETLGHRVGEDKLFSDDLTLDMSKDELSKLEIKP